MSKKYKILRWKGLIAFALLYNIVYLARFSVNNYIDEISTEMNFSGSKEELLSMCVFISYAIGSLINGPLADKLGSKKIIFIGGMMSAILNISIYAVKTWNVIMIIWIANGYFQSMIWIGGIIYISKWWNDRGKGISIGIANFASGLSHVTAYVLPVVILSIVPGYTWKMNFVLPMLILVLFLILFESVAVESPEKINMQDERCNSEKEIKRNEEINERIKSGEYAWEIIIKKKNFLWWCAIATISSICRYGLLNWIPQYYSSLDNHVVISNTFQNLTLPAGMAIGTLIVTWTAGLRFKNNKGLIIIVLAAICGTLVVIFPMIYEPQPILIGIFFTGFALYGINGILWLHAIDEGGQELSGTAAGILNAFAYFGAFFERILFPSTLKVFGTEMSIFITIEVLCILMVVCGMVVSKKDKYTTK